ncbi:MAG: sterol desaturase family protein [Alphaproteobacteria bacterium]|nr:sterol desaturase family protein [Alphaproteobacteria bacterium]
MAAARVAMVVLFFAMLLVELRVAWVERDRPLYRWKDSIESWCLLALTSAISGLSKLFLLVVYGAVLERFALWEWRGTALEYLLAFLAYDLVSYAFHRASHRVGFLWAIHVVHHQSEQFNLTVGMRTAPLRNLVDWPTLLPLALLGVPAWWVMMLFVIHMVGQYWIHTQRIPPLGPLEWFLNTPSHHRVHHGCQPGYQDVNFGANLIVFDRLFGTFRPETEPAVFGVTAPVPGFSPLRSTFQPFADVLDRSRAWSRSDRIRVWWKPPGWSPDGAKTPSTPPPPKRDLAIRSLPEALATATLASLLLFMAPAAMPSLPTVLALLGFGGLALHRVGLCFDDGSAGAGDTVFAVGLATTAFLVPSHAVLFALGAVLCTALALSAQREPRSEGSADAFA